MTTVVLLIVGGALALFGAVVLLVLYAWYSRGEEEWKQFDAMKRFDPPITIPPGESRTFEIRLNKGESTDPPKK